MAAITRDEPESGSPGSIQIDSGPTEAGAGRPPEKLSLGNLPVRYRWAMGIALVLIVLVASRLIWGPSMDFPTTVKSIPVETSNGATITLERSVRDVTGGAIDQGVEWLTINGSWFFDGLSTGVTYALVYIEKWQLVF
jgi:hypothetical protein